ncbi:MAG: tripartite tricarboxylate transporter substrate binding protein [Rhodoferax sp.]|uniref:tripartite tricarboxylate transporter substrate binding protein n=1 Tax=Rhodoferax sp. TaxID=50421 RepID=UPI0008D48406|nr:tripartite tricarboxylate transporter substrate binding protein [Rhodoferax sp.]MDP2678080.1 tripartite tricarboxylate transporter substrate binding protein [Rhodoferax sp.]OGB59698.1 MAG: tricarboxylate transport protein TctC [Burkholderiales bacterium RIFOXYD12_FULL_59_19]OGB66877.1 MAG: tricarboxylate transport protein TctC [Burkholderiales bacterium RIFOXYC12_FULL_60_6]OGB82510.1 MAG: tricarboxylate transport protein TctC [Burkholderiales bacterium RIFOXYD2_FULL_59_8]
MNFRRQLLGAAALALISTLGHAQTYPDRELSGIIQWGAGGATDVVARSLVPLAEEVLGKKIVLQNKAGGVGAIATNFVNQQASDGYTLLIGAENPQIHPILGISDLDYSKFYPVNIIGRGNVYVVTTVDKPWKTFKDLLNDVQANPGKIKQGSTGTGGLPFTVSSMISTVAKFPTTSVPFAGDGPGVTALLGGHVDFMFVGVGAAAEHIKAGRLKALAAISAEPFEGVPPITNDLPGIAKYLPWGPFYGVFVKKDVPDAAKAKLTAAFKTAANDPKFAAFMKDRGNVMMNISGAEADAFLKKWQSVTSWTYQEVGVAKVDPASLGIAKP